MSPPPENDPVTAKLTVNNIPPKKAVKLVTAKRTVCGKIGHRPNGGSKDTVKTGGVYVTVKTVTVLILFLLAVTKMASNQLTRTFCRVTNDFLVTAQR